MMEGTMSLSGPSTSIMPSMVGVALVTPGVARMSFKISRQFFSSASRGLRFSGSIDVP